MRGRVSWLSPQPSSRWYRSPLEPECGHLLWFCAPSCVSCRALSRSASSLWPVRWAVLRPGRRQVPLSDCCFWRRSLSPPADTVEAVNLDRLLHASPRDARLARAKVEVLARALRRSATAAHARVEGLELSVTDPVGLVVALDCDVLFSCVNVSGPVPCSTWPLTPAWYLSLMAGSCSAGAVAGGWNARASTTRSWSRWSVPACSMTRLTWPASARTTRYGATTKSSALRGGSRRRDVSAAQRGDHPGRCRGPGAHLCHFATSTLDRRTDGCLPGCPYSGTLLALGDTHPFDITDQHPAADAAPAARHAATRPRGSPGNWTTFSGGSFSGLIRMQRGMRRRPLCRR